MVDNLLTDYDVKVLIASRLVTSSPLVERFWSFAHRGTNSKLFYSFSHAGFTPAHNSLFMPLVSFSSQSITHLSALAVLSGSIVGRLISGLSYVV